MPSIADLIGDLQRTGFRDLAGAHVAATVPIAPALLNQLVADALPRGAVVRRVEVRPRSDDLFDVTVALTWSLVPPLTITLAVERQPEFRDSPILVLRWSLAAGLGAIASQFVGAINHRLPRGVRLDGDRVLLDIPVLAEGTAAAPVLPYVTALRLHARDGRAIVHVELGVA
jgi:hypothetical protein